MTSPVEATLAYAEQFHHEDEILHAARQRGLEMGAPPILPGGGAALCFRVQVQRIAGHVFAHFHHNGIFPVGQLFHIQFGAKGVLGGRVAVEHGVVAEAHYLQIGRASCRERV